MFWVLFQENPLSKQLICIVTTLPTLEIHRQLCVVVYEMCSMFRRLFSGCTSCVRIKKRHDDDGVDSRETVMFWSLFAPSTCCLMFPYLLGWGRPESCFVVETTWLLARNSEIELSHCEHYCETALLHEPSSALGSGSYAQLTLIAMFNWLGMTIAFIDIEAAACFKKIYVGCVLHRSQISLLVFLFTICSLSF